MISEEKKQAVLALCAKRANYSDVAAQCGVTRGQVAGIVHRATTKDKPRLRNGGRPSPAPLPAAPTARPAASSGGGTCTYIAGDTGKPGWSFCGAPAVGPERSWCAEHRPRVYHRRPDRRVAT